MKILDRIKFGKQENLKIYETKNLDYPIPVPRLELWLVIVMNFNELSCRDDRISLICHYEE